MSKESILILFLVIHCIGIILTTIIHIKNGVYENAAKYGDGFRTAKPFDVLFLDCCVWEIQLFIYLFALFEKFFNRLFEKS